MEDEGIPAARLSLCCRGLNEAARAGDGREGEKFCVTEVLRAGEEDPAESLSIRCEAEDCGLDWKCTDQP
jgi:hypothetical protein